MSSALNLTELLSQLEAEEAASPTAASAPAAPLRPVARSSASIMPAGDGEIQAADLQRMVGEAQRNVRLRSGLIGTVMTRLRGNDLERAEYRTMLARIDAYNGSEQAKLALLLVGSLQVLGFKVAVSSIEDMERFLARFDPNSTAGRLGRELLAENAQVLHQVVQEIAGRGRGQITRPLGVG